MRTCGSAKKKRVLSLSSLHVNLGGFFFLFQQKQEEDNEEKEQSKRGRRAEWVGADRVKPNRIKCNLA